MDKYYQFAYDETRRYVQTIVATHLDEAWEKFYDGERAQYREEVGYVGIDDSSVDVVEVKRNG